MSIITNEEILCEINSLPLEAQRQIKDFVSFLRERYKNSQPKLVSIPDLETETFVGMWRDREDMRDFWKSAVLSLRQFSR